MYNWGIISTAGIAHSRVGIINDLSNFTLLSIGSRNLEKAKKFKIKYNLKKHGYYEDIINDTDIHCVYIPLPTGIRSKYVILIKIQTKLQKIRTKTQISHDLTNSKIVK